MNTQIKQLAAATILMTLSVMPTWAQKPESPGNNGQSKSESSRAHHSSRDDRNTSYQAYFSDARQTLIRNYYAQARDAKRCPPGLAKKNNGCQPPGQAKKWRRGQPLPGDVIYYDLPAALLHQLGRTPEGQKIVRVGTDLLLISIGTGLVLDAFENLGDIL